MIHFRYMFVASWTTVTLMLCSSLVNAETPANSRHSLILRPTLQHRPPVTLDSAASPSRIDHNSVSTTTPQAPLRHKLVRRPTVPPLATVQPNGTLPTNSLKLTDTSSATKP